MTPNKMPLILITLFLLDASIIIVNQIIQFGRCRFFFIKITNKLFSTCAAGNCLEISLQMNKKMQKTQVSAGRESKEKHEER